MATHTPVPASVVGNSFVMRYYTVLNSSPDLLHHFYQEQSICCHGTEGHGSEQVTGMKNIHAKLSSSFPEKGSTVTLSVVDIQESLEGSVIVMVIGSMNNPGKASKRFVQSFVLAKQQPEGFYVRNDMLRYVSEPEGKGEQATASTAPASSAPSVVPEQRKQEGPQKAVDAAAPSTTSAPTSAATTAQPASTQAHPALTPAAKESAPAPAQPQQPQAQAPKETPAPAVKEPQQPAAEKPHAQPEKVAQPQQQPAPATAPAPTPAPAQNPAPAQAPAPAATVPKETAPQTQAPAAAAPKEAAHAKPAEKPPVAGEKAVVAPAADKANDGAAKPASAKGFSWASVAAAAAANPAPVTMPPPPKKEAQAKPAANATAPAATTPAAQSPAQTHNQQPAGANGKPQKTKAEFEADSTWVYVNNLPYTTTLDNVVKHFSVLGPIKVTESHIPKGYAFLKYETKEIATSVIEHAKKVPVNMEGRHVTVDWRQTKPVKDRRNKPDKADRPHKPKPFTNGANGSPKDHPRKPKDKPQQPTNNTATAQPSPKPTPAKDHQ